MADGTADRSRWSRALPVYGLTGLGGLLGIFWVNASAHASPILGIGLGALAGRLVAALVVWLVEARELRRTAAVRAGAESAGRDGAAEPEDPPAG
ncbi:hypothetical protein [Pontibaca methylaminivorans]|uniref:Uncharacterized protein n=1 Tax=Pontibaca methylaminivorans TaxID=515897 RepID=A0A1R3WJ36_9RHOB|nr:hypothetical protein [Pontibaca methylaminivorans]SIT77937.1 hypothetical protein SAMN05421849_0858 [Pontibaca methylaminivorans]